MTVADVLRLIVYVCCSAGGLVLIKLGINKSFAITAGNGGFELRMSWIILLGALLYVASFLLSLFILSKTNLSVFYPLSAGLIYTAICALSIVLLKESMTLTKGIGMAVILAGVVIMNLQKK